MKGLVKFLSLALLLVLASSCGHERTLEFELTNATDYILEEIVLEAGCEDSAGEIAISLNPRETSDVQSLRYKGCTAEFFSEPFVKGHIRKILTEKHQQVDITGSWLHGRYELEQNIINKVEIRFDSAANRMTFVLMN